MKSFPFLLNFKKHFRTAYNLQLQLYHHVKNSCVVSKVAGKHVKIVFNMPSSWMLQQP